MLETLSGVRFGKEISELIVEGDGFQIKVTVGFDVRSAVMKAVIMGNVDRTLVVTIKRAGLPEVDAHVA